MLKRYPMQTETVAESYRMKWLLHNAKYKNENRNIWFRALQLILRRVFEFLVQKKVRQIKQLLRHKGQFSASW